MKLSTVMMLCVASLASLSTKADISPFDFAENNVESSPTEAKTLHLGKNETLVDFDVSPIRPQAAIVIKTTEGKQKLIFWLMGTKDGTLENSALEIPGDVNINAITWHPLGKSIFLLATKNNQQEILINSIQSWAPKSIYRSTAQLRRLVVGPRPFEIGYDEKTKSTLTNYRIFFAVKNENGHYATHTITETGAREYAVLDSKSGAFPIGDGDESEQPNVLIASSALPVGFHPAGHFFIWEDEKNCFQKAEYGTNNWDRSAKIAEGDPICKGSLTYTPNGIGLLHWQKGVDGVTLRYDRGSKVVQLAKTIRFISTPSSVADGKGIVGVTKEEGGFAIHYVPVDVPLSDVVNAWMFLESPKDRELFLANTGLFRELPSNQLYELYDSESYHCGGYDQSTPSRPYLVTTDIFWELYASAFEGIFILSEKQAAVPNFWKFVQSASDSLKAKPESKITKVFAALIAVKDGITTNSEAAKILASSGISNSSITNDKFDFGDLKPRSHYVTDVELQNYFRASKYLMSIQFDNVDIEQLKKLPSDVIQNALAWIDIYTPFIAPSKRPLVWKSHTTMPKYILHPDKNTQLFPLSWGMDNEILFSTVYHDSLPKAEQIAGPNGLRLLPSGLDIASVLGSKFAETILTETGEFQKYPPLKIQIDNLKIRYSESKNVNNTSLYQQWISGLSTQWAESITAPGGVIQKNFWLRKRLQTGLASWATLRHATLLVNERSVAECGESGFEQIVLRPPRGYVEPDPATFDVISGLFDATIQMVKTHGTQWTGSTLTENGDAPDLQNGVIRRLTESRDKIREFRDMAKKELDGQPLTNQEYEKILYVGRAAEHNFLIFKSLAQKEFALSTPDPIPKVADVAGASGQYLLAGVGNPLEWDQIVPFFGRKQIVKGSSYSYYETVANEVMDDGEWRAKLATHSRPKWIADFVSKNSLSCPAKAP
ncbi:MAG: DUF3160 domain-containing protein [Pseudomonadota bacterium]